MTRSVRLLLGFLLILVGLVWLFQGIGVLKGSFMTDQPVWAVIGVALVGIGIGLIIQLRPGRR